MPAVAVPIALFLAALTSPADAFSRDCAIGSYILEDGSYVDIAPSNDESLRWRRRDGTTGALSKSPEGGWISTLGWTNQPDGVEVSFDCAAHLIEFSGQSGERIEFDVEETEFNVGGATLAGRLVMPQGDNPVPVVILVHGAERISAREFYALQRMFPAAGIGAFVYDKRGTGASTGKYTQDYLMLATDAIAAFREAKRLGGERVARIGYQAGSQGGWVAPLAAKIEPIDFIIIGFGLAVSPSAAERELIAADIARQGFGLEAEAKAMELAAAIERIIESNFREGYDELADVRGKYENEPWFDGVRGSATEIILNMSTDELKRNGPAFTPNVPLYYDPMPVLRNLATPQLWILGGDDIVAPPGETANRLAKLAAAGKPITAVIFAKTDHGIHEYEMKPDGSRVSTRAPDGYFAMMRDFILTGRSGPQYGTEMVTPLNHSE